MVRHARVARRSADRAARPAARGGGGRHRRRPGAQPGHDRRQHRARRPRGRLPARHGRARARRSWLRSARGERAVPAARVLRRRDAHRLEPDELAREVEVPKLPRPARLGLRPARPGRGQLRDRQRRGHRRRPAAAAGRDRWRGGARCSSTPDVDLSGGLCGRGARRRSASSAYEAADEAFGDLNATASTGESMARVFARRAVQAALGRLQDGGARMSANVDSGHRQRDRSERSSVDTAHDPRATCCARPSAHRDAHRLRHRQLRRLHGDAQRRDGEVLLRARRRRRRPGDYDDRGAQLERERPASDPGGVRRATRASSAASARPDDPVGPQLLQENPDPTRGRDPPRDRRQPLPLHRLPLIVKSVLDAARVMREPAPAAR